MRSVSTRVREARIGDPVRFIDAPSGPTGTIEGEHDGASVVYWGTENGKRVTTIEVLGDSRSRCFLSYPH